MVHALTMDGIALVPPMPKAHADEMMGYLLARQVYPGHVQASPASAVTCWTMADVLKAPYFFEFALALTGIAADYLERPPLLYSLNAFTTYPGHGPTLDYIQEFHRDKDDERFVALFVYLTDVVEEADGAHQFQDGTHRGTDSGAVVTVLGPAGTAFLVDTSGLHRGVRPAQTARTMVWARWGVSDPPIAYDWDRLSPSPRTVLGDRYPENQQLRDSIRLVVR